METSKVPKNKEQIGINGIANLGNTCYLNAAVQCLLRIQPLTDYFLNQLHKHEINENNVLGTQGRITTAFVDIMM